MTDADDIARRAREIGARAERIAEDSSDAEALREELDRLDAELAQLDEEQRRLDDELRDRGDQPTTEPVQSSSRPAWAETVFDLVSDVTERISALGSSGWPWRSSETIERTVAIDAVTPVVIENRAGSIKVQTGDVNVVKVSAELFAPSAHLLEEMAVTAELEGSQVMIRCDWPEHRRGTTGSADRNRPFRHARARQYLRRIGHGEADARTRHGRDQRWIDQDHRRER